MKNAPLVAVLLCALLAANSATGLLVTSTWTAGANSGMWSDASNWSTSPDFPRNQIPLGTTYNALINAAGGVYTINFDAGSISLAGLQLSAPLATINQQVGTLWVDAGTISGTYLLNGGVLGGSGSINVNGAMEFSGGTLAGPGALNILSGGSLTVGTLSTRTLSRTLANAGTVNFLSFSNLTLNDGTFLNTGWTNFNNVTSAFGFGGGTSNLVNNSGTFNINAASTTFQFSSPTGYVNSGTINVQAGTANFGFGTYVHNAGTRFTGNGTIVAGGGTMIFNGASTFSTSRIYLNGTNLYGAGSITNNTNLVWNAGTIEGSGRLINNATLTIGTLGTRALGRLLVNNATIDFASGSALNFSNGTLLNNGWTNFNGFTSLNVGVGSNNLINNAGTLSFNAPTSTFQWSNSIAYLNSGTINVQAGTMTYGFGTYTHENGTRFTGNGTLLLNSGTMIFNGDSTLSVGRTRLEGSFLGGPGDLYLTSITDWNNGSIAGGGAVQNSGTLNIGTFSTRLLAKNLVNTGTINFLANASLTLSGGTFDNQSYVNFDNAFIPFNQGVGSNNFINNAGTFNINSPSSSFQMGMSFTSSGVINVLAGTAMFNSGTYTYSAGSRIIGPGTILANNGTFLFTGASTISAARTIFNGALIRTSDALTLTETTDWNAGSISGTGFINNVGTLNIGTLSTHILSTTLINNATVNFASGTSLALNNGTFINNGFTQVNGSNPFSAGFGSSNFIGNAGTLNIDAPLQTVLLPVGYTNSGVIAVQSGTLQLSNQYFFHDPGTRLVGAGSIAANSGTLVFLGDGTVSTAQFALAGATITGSGTLHLHSGASWTSGLMNGMGTTTIEPGGLLTVAPGFSPTLSRYLVNNGQATLQTSAVLVLHNGTFINGSAGTLFLNSNPNFFTNTTGLLRNDGTIQVSAGTVTISVPFVNNGTVVVGATPAPGGPASAPPIVQLSLANLPQLSAGVLTGGSWVVNNDGELHFPGPVIENQASITLNGSAVVAELSGLTVNGGTLALTGGQSFTAAGSFTNNGWVRIGPGSQLTVPGDLLGSGTVDLNGSISIGGSAHVGEVIGSQALTIPAGQTFEAGRIRLPKVNVDGELILSESAPSSASSIDELNITGIVDVTTNDLIVKGDVATIAMLLKTGYNGGLWNGNGIVSSIATANGKTLGYATATQLFGSLPALYRGVVVDQNSVIIAYANPGDTNLDGKVNTLDFNNLAGSFGTTGGAWMNGDFNYSDSVDSLDFDLLVANYGKSNAASASSLGQLVPEPASGFLIACLGSMLLRRGRR